MLVMTRNVADRTVIDRTVIDRTLAGRTVAQFRVWLVRPISVHTLGKHQKHHVPAHLI